MVYYKEHYPRREAIREYIEQLMDAGKSAEDIARLTGHSVKATERAIINIEKDREIAKKEAEK